VQHSPLDPGQLSAAAQRALGPGPMKLMAARGLAPLPDPGDLITVLYQLSLDGDAQVSGAAKKSAAELPDKVLAGALAQPLDPRVLDFFAARVTDRRPLLEAVILNPATDDSTIAALAGSSPAPPVDLIAQNEQRLLRHPAIIGAMYTNPAARMSTVDRAIELAVRNQIKVPGIAAWDEICAALMGRGKDRVQTTDDEADELFARAATTLKDESEDGTAEARELPLSKMTIPMKIRLATLGNSFARAQFIRDPMKMVAVAAIKAPGVTDMEAAKYANNHSLVEDVISYIANRREWTKLYGVKLALVQNPKTPITAATRFLTHLREKDLRVVSRSKGVSSAVAAQARKLVMARQRGPQKP
jgi:hypothetical protein